LQVALNGGRPLLAKQQQLVESRAFARGIFGGWGSGKTMGAALATIVHALRNPWTPEYGRDRPFSLVVGLTHKVLKDSAHRELMSVLPPELVLREWRSPDWEALLANGHMIKFRTVKGALEGASASGVWVDEAHLVREETVLLNYQARARDPRAASRMFLVSGLPEDGPVREMFDGQEDANRIALLCSTYDNHYLPAEVVEQFKRSCASKSAIKYLEGKWMPAENAVYYEYSAITHVTASPIRRDATHHVSMDIGDQAAVLWLQEREVPIAKVQRGRRLTAPGLHVVDEILPEQQSTRAVCRAIKARGHRLVKGESLIFVDPTIRRDELNAIYEELPGFDVIRKRRGDKAEATEYGHACVNAALRNADGDVRLTFADSMPRTRRSLLSVIGKFRRDKRGRPVRDDTVDHVLDALRYPVAHLLPLLRGGHDVRDRAA